MQNKTKKLSIYTHDNTPYRHDLYTYLINNGNYDITVNYCINHEPHRLWEVPDANLYRSRKISGLSIHGTKKNNYKQWHINPGIFRDLFLDKIRGRYVIFRDPSANKHIVAPLAKLFNFNLTIWNGQIKPPYYSLSFKNKLKLTTDKWLFQSAKKIIVYSSKARDYILSFPGIRPERVVYLGNYVNNDFYMDLHEKLKGRNEEIREELEVARGDKIVLYVGVFIERKAIREMVEVYQKMIKKQGNIHIIFVGNGYFKDFLLETIRDKNLTKMSVVDFQQSKDLAKYYQAADILWLPSVEEPWGLVVNEAMCLGTIPVISDACGSTDIIMEGENGAIVPVGNTDLLAEKTLDILSDEVKIRKMSKNAYNTMKDFSFKNAMDCFDKITGR